jgi:hypothetical protein
LVFGLWLWQKVFDMDFPQIPKSFELFEPPLLRNAQKRHKPPPQNKGTYPPHLAAIWQIYVAFSNFFLRRPLICMFSRLKYVRAALQTWLQSSQEPTGGPLDSEVSLHM